MNLIVSKILTGVLSEKVLIAVLLRVGDFLVEKSSNELKVISFNLRYLSISFNFNPVSFEISSIVGS